MPKAEKKTKTIDDYIGTFPKDIRDILEKMRVTIRKSAPKAEETISYGMPAFRQGSVLVYFAAFKDHIGFFPTSSPIVVFKKELTPYKTSKGTIQFALDKPIPLGLVKKIVAFRVKESQKKVKRDK
jgi:uncharacterized protein YdhG (YjbR/CyaY superfamily)